LFGRARSSSSRFTCSSWFGEFRSFSSCFSNSFRTFAARTSSSEGI